MASFRNGFESKMTPKGFPIKINLFFGWESLGQKRPANPAK